MGGNFCTIQKEMLVVCERMERCNKESTGCNKASNEGTINLHQQCQHMGAFPGPAPILAVHHLLTPKDKSFLPGQGEGVVLHWTPSCSMYLLRRRLLPHLVSIVCNYILRRTVHPDHEDGVQMSMWIHSSWLILILLDSQSQKVLLKA